MENIPKIIEETLNILGQKFGTTGELLWKSILKQQIIDGIMNLFVSLIVLIVMVFSIKNVSEDMWWLWFILGLSLTFFIICLWQGLSYLLNPEKSAFDDVMSYFKKDN